MKENVPIDWLTHPTTVEIQESLHTYNGVVFGCCNAEWCELLSKMKPTDRLWEYDSRTWRHRCGRCGVALVRDGRIIDSFITKMN